MKFAVYQRRMFVETLKNKAVLMAMIDPPKAAQLATDYVKYSAPVDPESLERVERDKQRQIDEVEKMDPIPISQVILGTPMNQPYVKGA